MSKILRVDETPTQRAARLRAELHAVGDPAAPPATAPPADSDAALAQERDEYMAMKLDAVLEREIKTALALPYDKLWAKDRQQLIKAGVGLMLARAKVGQQWGLGLLDDDDDDAGGEDEA